MFLRSLLVAAVMFSAAVHAQTPPDALLSIDQNRTTVIDRIMRDTGDAVVRTQSITMSQLREMLDGLRADELLAASLAGTGEGLRDVIASALVRGSNTPTRMLQAKSLGDSNADVTYTPVTPCRLVDTRGFFSPVYAGGPFSSNEIRTYTIQGGNGACLSQLPAGLNPAALQLQVFAMPTTSGSGDLEILPQGASFGGTATMVYIASIAFNTVSTSAKVNTANNQISMQVRGGGAHVAIDVVGYFGKPSGTGGQYFRQGGNTFGANAVVGTIDNFPVRINANNQRVLLIEPTSSAPNVVGGIFNNFADVGVVGATVGGGGAGGNSMPGVGYPCPFTNGCANVVANSWGTVGGGAGNQAGGGSNRLLATVGGGFSNVAAGQWSVVAGGASNNADGESAAIAGGNSNQAFGSYAAVAGGSLNSASGQGATVAGGQSNIASGHYSAVSGGIFSRAAGIGSIAAGYSANAAFDGCIVFGDNSTFNDVSCGTAHQFVVRALGGVYLLTAGNADFAGGGNTAYTGAKLAPGSSSWAPHSDRAGKDNILVVDPVAVLERLSRIPIATWNWKSQPPGIRHMGPMSQDFHAAFGLGEDDKHISTVDADGVALAAIQGLNSKLEQLIAQLIAKQEALNAAHQRELRRLDAQVNRLTKAAQPRQSTSNLN